ncbi:hypothetical protein GCM10007874_16070 [Labrys miyagiensis]|uniref:Uncharacterized protein n=1 Tax=Labrys miyagiensis TaxID=346912 RepID=A0ABQ6CEK2_9HYPH|nr:hypothetical protein GCM10007874_16070 [Labrys miyagiensis]
MLDGCVDIEGHVELRQEFPGAGVHVTPIDPAIAPGLVADEDIFSDCEVGEKGRVLVHHGNPLTPALQGRQQLEGLALFQDLPGIGLVHAAYDLHQRALAGTVFAGEGMHAAWPQGQTYIDEYIDGAETLTDVLQIEHRYGQGRCTLKAFCDLLESPGITKTRRNNELKQKSVSS